MAVDGISGEVLSSGFTMDLSGFQDAARQEVRPEGLVKYWRYVRCRQRLYISEI